MTTGHAMAPAPPSAALAALREARWLGAARARAWATMLAVAGALAVAMFVVTTRAGSAPDPWGRPLGTDFTSFWTAARMALGFAPGSPWVLAAHEAAQHGSFPQAAGFAPDYYAFFYPPPFLLICLPLALLPYAGALAAWLAATGAAYLCVVRTLLPRSWPATLTAFAFPAFVVNAWHGQNGALSAALLGTAAIQLDRRPRLAGICLGALCFKPQLGLLVVPALLAARRWRSLAWAAASAATLCLGSLIILGPGAWQGFLATAPFAKAVMEHGMVSFANMASPFAAVRLLGAGVPAAWAAQAMVSLGVLAIVVMVARARPGARAEGAMLAAGACLATPFLLDYDLILLAMPLAWVAAEADRTGYLPWEKLSLVVAFLLPVTARPLAMHAGLPIAPLAVAALLAVVARRAGRGSGDGAVTPAEGEARARHLAWAACLAGTLAAVMVFALTGTRLALAPMLALSGAVAILLALHVVYGRWRGEPRIAAVSGALGTLLWSAIMAGITALAALRTGAPLIDDGLAHADAMLHLDTAAVVAWVARYRLLGRVLDIAYSSSVPLVFFEIALLACLKRETRMWQTCFVFAASSTLCVCVSAVAPAIGAIVHERMPAAVLAGLPGDAGSFHVGVFEAFRSGVSRVVDVRHLEGVVTFPSFHAVMALIVGYAVRDVRWLAPVAWIWAALILVSTIPIGGHYAIDLAAGASVWLAFTRLAERLGSKVMRVQGALRPGGSRAEPWPSFLQP